jgi:hypothetical protein
MGYIKILAVALLLVGVIGLPLVYIGCPAEAMSWLGVLCGLVGIYCGSWNTTGLSGIEPVSRRIKESNLYQLFCRQHDHHDQIRHAVHTRFELVNSDRQSDSLPLA